LLKANSTADDNSHLSTLRIRLAQDADSLDWNHGQANHYVVRQMMDGLVSVNSQGQVINQHAKAWSYRNDGRILVFELGRLVWTKDKEAVCAQHYIDAWNRSISKQVASPYAHYFDFIERDGPEKLKARADGCNKIFISLKHKDNNAHKRFSHWIFLPIHSTGTDPKNYWRTTNGPYRLTGHIPGEKYSLEINPDYTGIRKPSLKNIEFLIISDDSTALRLYETKSIHWIKDLPIFDYARLKARADYHETETAIGYFIGFNLKGKNVLTQRQRCAISNAIATEQIPSVLSGTEQPALGYWVPPSLRGQVGAATKSIVKTNHLRGQISSAFRSPIILYFYSKDIHKTLMTWLQQQLKTSLGVDVQLNMMDGKPYWQLLEKDPPSVFLSGTTAWYSDGVSFLEELSKSSVANWGHYASDEYGLLLKKIALATNPTKRAQLIERAEHQLIRKDCAIVPLYFRRTAYLQDTRCKGQVLNPLGDMDFANIKCH
jgi:oligopeptide transport system substrate-binding protein